jgi:hypothetical protein
MNIIFAAVRIFAETSIVKKCQLKVHGTVFFITQYPVYRDFVEQQQCVNKEQQGHS